MKTFFLDSSSSLRDLGHFSQYRQSIFHLPQQQCLVLTILRRFWGQTSNFKRFPTDSVGKEQRNMTNCFEQYAKFWLSHVGGAIYFQNLCAALLSTRGKEDSFQKKSHPSASTSVSKISLYQRRALHETIRKTNVDQSFSNKMNQVFLTLGEKSWMVKSQHRHDRIQVLNNYSNCCTLFCASAVSFNKVNTFE